MRYLVHKRLKSLEVAERRQVGDAEAMIHPPGDGLVNRPRQTAVGGPGLKLLSFFALSDTNLAREKRPGN